MNPCLACPDAYGATTAVLNTKSGWQPGPIPAVAALGTDHVIQPACFNMKALRRRRAHAGLKAFDSGIAATALFTHSHLITRNRRDFHDIDGLSLLAL